MVRAKENNLGAYAFLAGVVLAIVVGIFQKYLVGPTSEFPYITLLVLGLIVGFLNAGDKDSNTFLIASLSIVIVGGLGNSTLLFISNLNQSLNFLSEIMKALLVLFIPATIIVALKTVFSITNI